MLLGTRRQAITDIDSEGESADTQLIEPDEVSTDPDLVSIGVYGSIGSLHVCPPPPNCEANRALRGVYRSRSGVYRFLGVSMDL